jgi:hypothetical protein
MWYGGYMVGCLMGMVRSLTWWMICAVVGGQIEGLLAC